MKSTAASAKCNSLPAGTASQSEPESEASTRSLETQDLGPPRH